MNTGRRSYIQFSVLPCMATIIIVKDMDRAGSDKSVPKQS